MKIQCDVCEKQEASVFCSADEAALCSACDHRVHHANKLAGKHHRFALLHHKPPSCDICQEKGAFMFCKEDRAVLCGECDIQIHGANEQTQKHNRFLLTGVKLSDSSSPFPATSSGADEPTTSQSSPKSHGIEDTNNTIETCSVSISTTSSISEYLQTLPGWCVEDFLDPSSASNRFCKINQEDNGDVDLDMGFCQFGDLVNWVAEVSWKFKSLIGADFESFWVDGEWSHGDLTIVNTKL